MFGAACAAECETRYLRYLSIDLGDKRTGLAVGDSETGLVSPLTVLEVSMVVAQGDLLIEAIARASEEQLGPSRRPGSPGARLDSPGELVIGLPLNMDGTEGPRSKVVRAFARRVAQRTGRSFHYQDERLTSAQADWQMAKSGMTHQQKKERRDALAAAAILQDFLASTTRGAATEPEVKMTAREAVRQEAKRPEKP